MSQGLKSRNLTSASLRRGSGAHTVLIRMAVDEARAERIKALKSNHPELTWRLIAEKVGVDPRSAAEWGATGQISYDNATKLAKLFPEVTLDYIWRGDELPATPDLVGSMSSKEVRELREQLTSVQQDVKRILKALGLAEKEKAKAPRTKAKTARPPGPEIRTRRAG